MADKSARHPRLNADDLRRLQLKCVRPSARHVYGNTHSSAPAERHDADGRPVEGRSMPACAGSGAPASSAAAQRPRLPGHARTLSPGSTIATADLSAWPRPSKPMRVERAVQLAHWLLAALAELHAARVVLLNLSPETVAVGDDRAYIEDLTTAEVLDVVTERLPSLVPRTDAPAEFRPPELASLDNFGDERADLYAAGVMIYELLAGSESPSHRLCAPHDTVEMRAVHARVRPCAVQARCLSPATRLPCPSATWRLRRPSFRAFRSSCGECC
jgi:hypothetical protein